MLIMWGRPSRTTFSQVSDSNPNSESRPTNGAVPSGRDLGPADTSNASHTGTACCLPFIVTGGSSRYLITPRVARQVSPPAGTRPAGAAPSNRAVTLVVSHITG